MMLWLALPSATGRAAIAAMISTLTRAPAAGSSATVARHGR